MFCLSDFFHEIKEKKSYKGKKYGIIRKNDPNCGLFSSFIVILGGIKKCIEKGIVPVVDMQTYKTPYLRDEQVGKENVWEFYFQQPMSIGLDQINMAEAMIIDDGIDIVEVERPNINMEFLNDPSCIRYWRNICKKYIRFRPEIQSFLEKEYKALLAAHEGKILGILCRGTDYISIEPPGHPVQPNVDSVIVKARDVLMEKECECIFLATEDADIFRKFKIEFGNRVIVNQSDRFSNTGRRYLAEILREKNIDGYTYGLNYLATIYLLSRCDYLIAGRTSGLLGALLLGEQYEYQYFWNCGLY